MYLADHRHAGLVVASPGVTTTIVVAPGEASAVQRAAASLVRDLAQVCNADAVIVGDLPGRGRRVVVGTLGRSVAVDRAVADGLIDVGPLTDAGGGLRWEGFVIQEADGVLFVVGADTRGTVFGVYDLCEAMGVSPWYWFADVPVRTREHVTVARGVHVADWPSVRYRGIFINDEEELEAWAIAHTGDGTIGPETYERVFELILRLKGNYIWPAMHIGAFNHDPVNGRLAHEMGIVVGTSHCDILLRSNENEWQPWLAEQDEPVSYDFSLPGRNREKLLEYWRGSVEQNAAYDVTWTVGIRGTHDSGFVTAAIDGDEALSPEQKLAAKVDLLQDAITAQRELLTEVLGADAREIPQIFVPYKEVLPLYDAGLQVPDDVTIVWANDNFGYMRRFPAGAELGRSGGHGLYYHSSYWSEPPRSYLATSSTPLALMKHELAKSWDHGIRRLWVNNVGGIKPLELELEFFLRFAWEAGRETTTATVDGFVSQWIDAKFTGGHGDAVADLVDRYQRINQQRKLEHLDEQVFPQTGYGDEAARRLAELRATFDETNRVLAALPEHERDAFFQLVAVKTHLAYLVNAQFVHADRSLLAHDQGKLVAADRHLEISRAFEAQWRAMVHHYNHVMSGGRWAHVFTPDRFRPPVMALNPAARPALRVGAAGLGVTAWGQAPGARPELTFWPDGVATKWIEVFTTGVPGVAYAISADDWIDVAVTSGTVDHEMRIAVTVPDAASLRGSTGRIMVTSDVGVVELPVTVPDTPAPEDGFVGSVEADGYVSFDIARPDLRLEVGGRWVDRPLLGRTTPTAVEVLRTDDGDGPVLEFGMHLTTPGAHLLELHRLPTLDSTGRIRLGISVDDHRMVTLESTITDEHRGAWDQAVLDNVERMRVYLPYLDVGAHRLRVHGIDQHTTLTGLVIYTHDPLPTNLAPAPSTHSLRPSPAAAADPDPVADPVAPLTDVAERHYGIDPARLAAPDMIYAGPDFWETPTTFKPNFAVPQPRLGEAIVTTAPDGSKELPRLLPRGVARETGGTIALEAEQVLHQDAHAWTTPSVGAQAVTWTHTQAETAGRSGLAMRVASRGLRWDDPMSAPGLHYTVEVHTAGTYRMWLLAKHTDHSDDSLWVAVDGSPQPLDAQYCGGDLYTFGTAQIWCWAALTEVELAPGRHTLSLLARKSGLRVDRIFLTTHDDLPPLDKDWKPSS